MTKTFVLRTDATLSCEGSTLQFDGDNEVVIPLPIYEGLYNYSGVVEQQMLASRFLEYCSSFNAKQLSTTGVVQSNGSKLFILDNNHTIQDEVQRLSGLTISDKRVFQLCLELIGRGKDVHLISQNPVIRYKAELLGITAEPLKNNLFPPLKEQYTGMVEAYATPDVKAILYRHDRDAAIAVEQIYEHDKISWVENCFVRISSTDSSGEALGRYTNGKIVPLQYNKTLPGKIKASNFEQKMLFEALLAPPEIAPLVIVKGPAGTGKTFCSLAVGLNNLANYSDNSDLYQQILVASPTIGMDDEIGFLPGSIEDKVNPYLGGITDNLKTLLRLANPDLRNDEIQDSCTELFQHHFIEVQAIRFLRGRSIPGTYFIIDEAQNIPVNIILDILTRAGLGSKIILMGDVSQINRPGLSTSYNGLTFASESMKGSPVCWQVSLNQNKNLRSILSQEALNRIQR